MKIECFICGACWDYFDKKYELGLAETAGTAAQYQGCVCPKCGSIGYISSCASDSTNKEVAK